MENRTIKVSHILAALGISIIICTGVTLFFGMAEKKSIADRGYVIEQTERVENSIP